MKKLATLSMCALSFLVASAGATYSIPVDLEVPGYRTPEQTSMTVEDGVYNITFAGEFGAAQEYELFTSETTQPMLDGVTYCLEFDYQCAEALDDVNWLYWPKNGVTQSWCHDWLKGHLAPTAEGEWGHAKLTFTDRFKYGFGRGTGHVVRLHLRPSSHVSGDKVGQPFSVKIKDISFVPVQAEAPETTDALPVEIGDVTKSDLEYVSKEVNADGEYTLTWQGNFAALGNSGHYIEYTAYTAEMPYGMMPGIDYKLVFEYKGPALDDFSGLYHADGLYGDNAGTQSKVSIPASENDWTTVELPLADRGSHNWWGWSATSSLRLNFNDGSYLSQEGANFGKPLTVQVRGLRFEPVILPQPEPETVNLTLTAIAPHEGEALQEDGSYVIKFTGEFAGNPWTEYEAHLSKLTADLVAGETYYLAFEYQADDVIDQFVGRYWDDTNPALIIGSTPDKVLPATDQWTPVLLPLTNRVDCGWGKAGHGMRIHFYNNARMTKPEATPASRAESKYGQPMTVKVRGFKYVPEKIVTAIENVAVDGAEAADAEPEYYNIQGQRVMNPGKGLYIVRQGSKVTKVIL